ncbi:Gfo/Idh/MocA family oxidoreductase [Arthrobacter sp. fls2-241-R2A-200]|uniref:Gfo/Idh/MocA family protein n=1 Tax=Arthrobacter sp. fls2-241-R2A-200 TaxID=3040281 RepID=UPI00254FD9B3|nr:Gfo/Idh/MocA family oxidoreductase [Arthrobacter sp. fls2-241-R2A-200]
MTSRPIRTAIAGFGLSGSVFHAPYIAGNPSYELTAFATSDPERQAQAAKRYPNAKIGDAPLDLVALADELDLIVLGTPPATHHRLAKAALEAGLDVVVDKPFVVHSADGEELIRLAASLGRVLTVYQNRRWDGDALTVQKLLDAGTLGEVTRFEAGMERWAPEIAKAWKASATAEDGGGVLFDLGTHVLDLALRFFGPATVTYAEIAARRAQENADDDVFLTLRHESGVISHVTINLNSHLHGPRFRVLGSRGAFVKFGSDPQEPFVRKGGLPSHPAYGVEPPENHGTLEVDGQQRTIPTERGAYPEFYRLLAEKLNDGGITSARPVPVDPADSVAVLRLIEQARRLA